MVKKNIFVFTIGLLVTGAQADIAFTNVSPVQFSLEPVASVERKIGDTRLNGLFWGGLAVIVTPGIVDDHRPVFGLEFGPEIRCYPLKKEIFCLSLYSGFAAMLVHYGSRSAPEPGVSYESSEYRLNAGFTTGIKSSLKLKICRFLSYEPYFSLSASAYSSYSYEEHEFLSTETGNALGMYLITIGNRIVFEL